MSDTVIAVRIVVGYADNTAGRPAHIVTKCRAILSVCIIPGAPVCLWQPARDCSTREKPFIIGRYLGVSR